MLKSLISDTVAYNNSGFSHTIYLKIKKKLYLFIIVDLNWLCTLLTSIFWTSQEYAWFAFNNFVFKVKLFRFIEFS